MTAQQVVKTDDGGEVRDVTSIVYIKLMYVRPRTSQLMDQYSRCMSCVSLYGECSRPCLWLRLIHTDMIS